MTEAMLNLLAVDDEPPQLEDLARMLRSNPCVGQVETAASGQEALLKASRRSYDAVFLDVRMPELDGLELARVLKAFAHKPALIFVSAFDASAVATFELRALDFLTKPVTAERVSEALRRVNALSSEQEATPREGGDDDAARELDDVIAVANTHEGRTRLVPRSSILYAKSYGDYTRLFADTGRYLLRGSLSDAERRFRGHGFLRVHRQYLANLRRAVEVRPMLNGTAILVFENGGRVPVARRHVPELRRRLRS